VPSPADGESIVGARLSLYVTNAAADGPAIWRTVPDWAEDTVTWGAQPARSGTASAGNFGNMNAGRLVSTSVSGVTTGGDVSFQLYADANDGLSVTSREGAPGTRPQLVLTLSAR